jgi:hypothetical protein
MINDFWSEDLSELELSPQTVAFLRGDVSSIEVIPKRWFQKHPRIKLNWMNSESSTHWLDNESINRFLSLMQGYAEIFDQRDNEAV